MKQRTPLLALPLPPSHLVRQDAVHRVVVQVDEPVEAVHLWCVCVGVGGEGVRVGVVHSLLPLPLPLAPGTDASSPP